MSAVVSFIVILSILILVHELGHFFIARKLGVKIEEFGIGYPPRLIGRKIKGIIYSVNLLPFGGFVRMLGEDVPEGRGSFATKKKRVRLAVLLAGVTMNFLLGVVLFGAIYTKLGIPEPVEYLVITDVAEGSPAEAAGLRPADKISGYEGIEAFIEFINQHQGKTVSLQLLDGRQIEVIPRLEADIPEGEGALGVAITNIDTVVYPVWQRPFRGMWLGIREALAWGKEIIVALGRTLSRLFVGQVPEDVAGPVGIYKISKQVTQQGWLSTFQFVGILSVNLAILNLLPLPALDGGRLMFLLVEAVSRKRVKPRLEQLIHLAGMVLLIGLMILVTINDLQRG